MDTLENNINLILDEISSLAQEERLAISKQAEDFQEKELSRVKESIEQGAERKIQDDMDEIIESAKKQIAQFDNDQKQKLLNHREELIQRVFALSLIHIFKPSAVFIGFNKLIAVIKR